MYLKLVPQELLNFVLKFSNNERKFAVYLSVAYDDKKR